MLVALAARLERLEAVLFGSSPPPQQSAAASTSKEEPLCLLRRVDRSAKQLDAKLPVDARFALSKASAARFPVDFGSALSTDEQREALAASFTDVARVSSELAQVQELAVVVLGSAPIAGASSWRRSARAVRPCAQ
jgi:hypothetical protein